MDSINPYYSLQSLGRLMSENPVKDVTLSLKVMINKEKTKVLFAEADCDFVRVLLSFMTLPLGRIAKLLENHYAEKSPVFGSLASLYKGLANLDDAYFTLTAAKHMLLHPPCSSDSLFRKCKLDLGNDSSSTKYLICWGRDSCKPKSVCLKYGDGYDARCDCGKRMIMDVDVKDDSEDAAVFATNTVSFIVSDDLKMLPNSAGFVENLSNLGVEVGEGAEIRNLILGTTEIMDLLKCALLSETPLTDFVLNNGEISSAAKPESGNFFHQNAKEETCNPKKIILKVVVQKSTKKLLFAQGGNDFVELLFTFLIIPMGRVESLLDTNTCLKNLDNLHRSLSDVGIDKYFITPDSKERFMNPKIAHFFKPKSTILPLDEESVPKLYYCYEEVILFFPQLFVSHNQSAMHNSAFSLKSPKGDVNYVKEPTTYMITDDLTVTPLCISDISSLLNRLNIPLSDVDELEVPIGLHEALSILKASLTSNSALTNGLISRLCNEETIEQEH